jgi:hypothetical protein
MPVCAACMSVAGPTLTKNYREIPITEQVEVVSLLGDVLRITCINALHESPHGVILLDVLLDHAGIPDGVDQAWQRKHYLGAPVPGATMATVNFAHVVTAVEFVVTVTRSMGLSSGTSRSCSTRGFPRSDASRAATVH